MWEADFGRIAFESSPGKRFMRFPSQWKKLGLGVVAYTCHPGYGEKPKIGGLQCRLAWTKSKTSKITRTKRTGGVAQVLEHLPKKCEALSSNPNTTKKTHHFSITSET
jgi:hypothetical protein